ncbi:PH-domain-containing protein [Polychaeton citri CBS 116435]|uniref:PH-domain-containing protein n=1 Tax=Polychaeton citri CBS 116435 TaxID=1314669 RepID=A0A9P4Q3M1_9PEZI|nr:PH-domain-containing protein [Polychaeton citri CBS 116435]
MTEIQSSPRPIPVTNQPLRLAPPSNITRPALDALSPVTQKGCFEFDRIIKSGEVLKRTRKTKSWKTIYLVLRPNLLSIYRDKDETKLRHQVQLSELTAVARQRDPKRKDKFVFALFSPSRNFHLEAKTEQDAQEWVELIRREARMDEAEEEMVLASPGGAAREYHGFHSLEGRLSKKDAHYTRDRGYSSSEAEMPGPLNSLAKTRERGSTLRTGPRRTSNLDYSGAEAASYSDFSDSGFGMTTAAQMSALSLSPSEGRPSTSGPSAQQIQSYDTVYGQTPQRPVGNRTASQLSNIGGNVSGTATKASQDQHDSERVIYHGWVYLLKSHSGVRQWKRTWMVLRPRALALYKNEGEYSALLILPFGNIIDVVEIDSISSSKTACMQIISEEKNYRVCCPDEDSLTRWLGAFKSLLTKRKTLQSQRQNSQTLSEGHPV